MTIQTLIFDRDKGGHFLDWSVLFVSGKDYYLDCASDSQVPLSKNPVGSNNSHKHKGNFAGRYQDLENFYKHDHCNVLFHQILNADQSYDSTGLETTKAIELAKQVSQKILVLKNHKDFLLYDFSFRRRSFSDYSFDGKRLVNGNTEYLQDFTKTFFKDSYEFWKEKQDLDNIWDTREFVALNFRPFENLDIKDFHAFDFDFYELNTKQLWNNFEIVELLDYLKIVPSQSRLEQWQSIYQTWSGLHTQKINFCLCFEEIINSILGNHDMDLEILDLDILQEAAIQHTLIYKHNLNLKTWQLDKFKNAKQLHNLLEENFHSLTVN
jgi:hypothetical protein